MPLEQARRATLRRMMHTFFDGSPAKTVAAILDEAREKIPADELDHLARIVEQARTQGR